ncbi:acetyltransferase [Halobacillus naozhouensis]|uniref:Acetyltransferase n=1 Tax=Halobacillus naozhouensis TaxID=554880 RepID=A0ABY8IVR5_9BACI|nr:acetyltransferase [Halobacillus naozhouensis]WFT74295.1 acetyltransferase [Halobacillus naozhouensis]
MTKLILIGAGGHSKVIQDIVAEDKDFALYAIVDDAFDDMNEVDGIIYANTSFLEGISVKNYLFCVAIGNNNIRRNLYNKFNIPLESYATLVHPSAVISKSAKIGHGTVVMPNGVVNADTIIGNHCIVNTNSVIEHDNIIGDYVHISPNATLSGAVTVDEGTHVGAGSVVIPSKNIGSWSTVGAGSVVINNIMENVTVVGVPAKELKP